jgi:hypothetical protein
MTAALAVSRSASVDISMVSNRANIHASVDHFDAAFEHGSEV